MYAVVNRLLGKDVSSLVLPDMDNMSATSTLSHLFQSKILTIRDELPDDGILDNVLLCTFTSQCLLQLVLVTEKQLRKITVTSKPAYPTKSNFHEDCFGSS